ncbi:molybdopterin-synthase adenylyltransferase MoeB [Tabrizicola sp. J26]|uniref:HesA/MoeB/ThiF family protein n=1 Tax=Alitabrizicola rongguiensis TaxID=2909234 RepID=UPI001F39710A|nr:HesA/MoeB/ThiF family protein [Tabrizicola rongguiensis]MCF1709141.1 molybdopterin-synthase adenylyltransferase MoeB [Tabrizicola rongguiensis]
MLLVLILVAVIWAIGWLMNAPVRLRLGMIGILWIGLILEHLALPDGHPLRLATGGDAKVWLVLGGAALTVLAYRLGLSRLRARAAVPVAVEPAGPFRPAELERYARHITLREIGGMGQRQLKQARVLVIGAGGLGSPALLYLAAAGVGTITVIDDDTVEASNLQRQIIHPDASLGQPKAESAAAAMSALNPFVTVRPVIARLTAENAADLFREQDLILDGSDNFDTRYLANEVAAKQGIPLLAAAITQWEGQISLYDPARGAPCYACIFPERPAPGTVPTCAEAGVAAPLPGVLGSLMALEAVKTFTGAGDTLRGRLMIFDGLHGENRIIRIARRKDCPVCGHVHAPASAGGWTVPSPSP